MLYYIKKEANRFLREIGLQMQRTENAETMPISKKLKSLKETVKKQIEISKMWSMKTNLIPIVIGALGLIRNGMNRYVEQIPGNIRVEELQKNVLLETAHLLRRALSMT